MARVVRALRRDRFAGSVALVAVALVIGAAIAFGVANSSAAPHLFDVGAWLANDQPGSITHANGLSGKPDARVGITNAQGHPLVVTQDGDVVLVTDTVTGEVNRIDPVHLTVTQAVSFGAPDVRVVANATTAYAVVPSLGVVQRFDPQHLSTIGPPIVLNGQLDEPALDGASTLWVPLHATGQVIPVADGVAGQPISVGAATSSLTLTIAGGTPVAIDPAGGTMSVLDRTGVREVVNLPAPTQATPGPAQVMVPQATASAVIPVVQKGSSQLIVVDTSTGTPSAVTLSDVDPDALGAPESLGDRIYLPDNSHGQLIVYDVPTGQLLNRIPVTGHGGRLDLFVKDGLLWVNDAQGDTAVSVDRTGVWHKVGKYDPQHPDQPTPTRKPIPTGTGTRPSEGTSPSRPAPSPPGTPSETAQPGKIVVRFTPSVGGPDYYSLGNVPAGAIVSPARVTGTPYEFDVTGLDCAQQYAFIVIAHFGKATAQTASGDKVRPCLAPFAPQNVALDGSQQHQLKATWAPPASDGGATPTYTVSWGAKSQPDLTATSFTVTGLTNFVSYVVTVTAANPAGSSAPASKTASPDPGHTWAGKIGNNCCLSVNLRQSADKNSASLGSFPPPGGQSVTVVCWTTGGSWADPSGSPSGNTWDKVRTGIGNGYVATGYVVNLPAGVWECT